LSKNINIGGENKIVISCYRRDWFGSKSWENCATVHVLWKKAGKYHNTRTGN